MIFNPLKTQKATRWSLLGLTWAAFLLRTLTLTGQSLWRDEIDAIRFSSWPLRQLVAGLFQAGHNGPLFFLLLRGWRCLAGDSEFALRYPSALLGMLAVPLGFSLARQLGFKRRAGLLFSLLLATSPYLAWYGQEAKMYTLLLWLVSLAFVAYLKALQGEGWGWWAVFVAASSLSFYTHILAPLMLGVYGLVGLLYRARRGWLISMAALTLPYLPLVFWQLPLLLDGFESGHPSYSLGEQVRILLLLYSRGIVRFADFIALLVFVFLLLSGLLLVRRSRRFILAAWLVIPLLGVYLISRRVTVFEDRYLIYITPAFYLLVVAGLLAIRRHSARLAALCLGLVLAINLVGVWQQQHYPIKADMRAAAHYLAGQPQPPPAIMVQIPYLRHTLAYYYPGDYALLEGLWTNNGKTEAEVAAEMRALTAPYRDLWLVVSEEDMWDRRHLTRAWLDTHTARLDEAHFRGVAVYHYRLGP